MAKYHVDGYDKHTGQKKTITVEATTTKHAKTVAYNYLTYPRNIRKA